MEKDFDKWNTKKKKIHGQPSAPFCHFGLIEGKDAFAVLSQVRLIDTKRLVKKMTTLDEALFKQLKNALQKTLFSER